MSETCSPRPPKKSAVGLGFGTLRRIGWFPEKSGGGGPIHSHLVGGFGKRCLKLMQDTTEWDNMHRKIDRFANKCEKEEAEGQWS